MTITLGYLNDASLKHRLLAAIRAQQAGHQIVRDQLGIGGSYGKEDGVWRGDLIGCVLHNLNAFAGTPTPSTRSAWELVDARQKLDTGARQRFPPELGIPLEIALLMNKIFLNLPEAIFLDWPLTVLTAIPVGADLSAVYPTLLQWMILDREKGLIAHARSAEDAATLTQLAATAARPYEEVTRDEWNALDDALEASGTLRAWVRTEAWMWTRACKWVGDFSVLAAQLLFLLRAEQAK